MFNKRSVATALIVAGAAFGASTTASADSFITIGTGGVPASTTPPAVLSAVS